MRSLEKVYYAVLSLFLAAFIIFISLPSIVSAEEEDGEVLDLGISSPVPDNYLYTGAATYRVPIEVPPGRHGIAPNIALTYNSYLKNGWVGAGWNLEMGHIRRSTKYGADYNACDFVANINGSSIELTPKTDCTGNEYQAKIEGTFYRYYRDPSTGGWIVTAKDGTKFFYGTDAYSRQNFSGDGTKIFKWCLDMVQDTNGNFMTLTYDKITGEIYLKGIDYTYNSGLGASNHIIFHREPRSDHPLMYTTNFPVWTSERLKTIEVKNDLGEVRAYQLNYSDSVKTGQSLLTGIQEYGNDVSLDTYGNILSGSSLPAMTFGYSGGGSELSLALDTGLLTGDRWSYAKFYSTIRFADINGDGKADLCARDNVNDGVKCWVSTDTGFSATPIIGPEFFQGNEWDSKLYYSSIQFADIDGDGKADLCGRGNKIYCYLSNGGEFSTTVYGPGLDASWNFYRYYSTIQFADINGDGKADVCGRGGEGIKCWLSYGTYFAATETPIVGPAWADTPEGGTGGWDAAKYFTTIRFADINGDGKADVCGRNRYKILCHLSTGTGFDLVNTIEGPTWSDTEKWNLPEHYSTIRFVDVNGDGKADVCGRGAEGIECWLSDGTAFPTKVDGPNWSNTAGWDQPVRYSTIRFADINGDGKADVCARGGNGIICYLSNGSGFPTQVTVSGSQWDTGWGTPDNFTTIRMADINGDGKADICGRSNGGIVCKKVVEDGTEALRTIYNGIGGSTTIEYAPFSNPANSSNVLPFVVQTVSSITVDDGKDNSSKTEYAYSGGKYDFTSREFRGFNYTWQTNPDKTKIESKFHQDDIRKGLINEQAVTDFLNNPYTKTVNDFDSISPPYLLWKHDYIYDGAATFKQIDTSFDYDLYGNITGKYFYGDTSVAADDKTECFDYQQDTSNWMVSLVKKTHIYEGIINCSNIGNAIPKAQTWFDYEPVTGNLLTKTLWLEGDKANPKNPTIGYTYEYGNVKTVTDANGKQTIIDYSPDDPTYTFPTMITQPAVNNNDNIVTKALYDNVFHKLSQQTDPNNNTTSYLYDEFGRIKKVTNPDGGTTSYDYQDFGGVYVQRVTATATISGASDYIAKTSFFDGLGRTFSENTYGSNGAERSSKITTIETSYNKMGRLSYKSFPFFTDGVGVELETPRWTHFDYDPLGRLMITIVNPGTDHAVFSSRSYLHGATTIYDENNNKKVEERDVYGRLVKVKEYVTEETDGVPNSFVSEYATQYNYDVLNNLRTVTDSDGNITTIVYDPLSRKTSISDPDMGYWQYPEYDKNGNLLKQIDAKGQTIYFQYDALNRIRQKDYAIKKDLDYGDIIFKYDEVFSPTSNGKGMLTTVIDASGTSNYSYDKLGRIETLTKTVGGTSYTVGTAYDALGRTASVIYPDESISYLYDIDGNLKQVGSYVTYQNYNALGQVGTVEFDNRVKTTYLYWTDNRLHSILTNGPVPPPTVPSLQWVTYWYDNVGNITTISNHLNDDASPLMESAIFAYNSLKNDNSLRPHAVSSIGENSYIYDANGNMTNAPGKSITYDFDNMPSSITYNNVTTNFAYDYSGQRVKKGNTVYIDKLYECIGTTCTKHIYAGDQRIATKVGSDIYYYHPDHLGSPVVITDANGSNVKGLKYAAFGETISDTDTSRTIPYRYTGQELDSDTSLYYYGARYYDPTFGRFISPDSIVPDYSNPQSFNRYSYVINNPLIYTDPTGQTWNEWWGSYSGSDIGMDLYNYAGSDYWNSFTGISWSNTGYYGGSSLENNSNSYWSYIGGLRSGPSDNSAGSNVGSSIGSNAANFARTQYETNALSWAYLNIGMAKEPSFGTLPHNKCNEFLYAAYGGGSNLLITLKNSGYFIPTISDLADPSFARNRLDYINGGDPQPGDMMVWYNQALNVHHGGIFVGDGMVIHATPKVGLKMSTISYINGRYNNVVTPVIRRYKY